MARQIDELPEADRRPHEGTGFPEGAPAARKGKLIVLTGPSGVGKGTLVERVLPAVPNLVKSVSVTTRTRRPQEVEGVDYFFRSREEFELLKSGLLEWAEFAGNCYGTPAAWVDEQLSAGKDVLLEIEVQGARQIFKKQEQSLLIFVSPPSFAALRKRLENRGTESADKIERRLETAREELSQRFDFHYEVINDVLDEAVNNLVHIVYAERCRIRK